MLRKALALLILLWCTGLTYGEDILPERLRGVWESSGNDHGTITITTSPIDAKSFRGVMTLAGSSYCTEPIPFRAHGEGSEAVIEGDTKTICGWRGKLSGRVVRESETRYTGTFSYTWLGITWVRGRFLLSPDP